MKKYSRKIKQSAKDEKLSSELSKTIEEKKVISEMSDVARHYIEDIASEKEIPPLPIEKEIDNEAEEDEEKEFYSNKLVDREQLDEFGNAKYPTSNLEEEGEYDSLSGSAANLDEDDDAEEAVKEVGLYYTDETEEEPEELDTAERIDYAEEKIRSH